MRGASGGDTRLKRRACRAPLPTIHRFHDIRKGFEREPRIAHKPYGFVITAYFAAVHVDMGKHGIGGVQRPRVRRVLVGPRAHQQDKIGLLKDGPLMASGRTGARGVGEHAERERVPFVHASLAHHRGRHRQGEMFLKPGKGRARRGEVHAAARDDHGVTAGKQTFRHAAHGIQRRHDRIKRIMAERDAPLFGLRRHTEHVVGEQEHDGTGPPGTGHREGLIHVVLHAVRRMYPPRPLGAGRKQTDMVEFLKRIAILILQRDLLKHDHKRNRGFQRFRKRGHHKRRRGAVLGDHDAGALADAGIAVRHVAAAVFGTVGDLAQSKFLKGQAEALREPLSEKLMDAVPQEHPSDAVPNRIVLFSTRCHLLFLSMPDATSGVLGYDSLKTSRLRRREAILWKSENLSACIPVREPPCISSAAPEGWNPCSDRESRPDFPL